MKENTIIFKILIIGLIVWIISHFFYQICFVHGQSMEPTLSDKDIVLVKKYNLDLHYGDVVVIKTNGEVIIKRIVGLPGDTIKIDHYLFVNGEKKDDNYMEDNGDINDVTLKKDQYFVLGDNRNFSIDSRFEEIGIIDRDDIIGKMIFG